MHAKRIFFLLVAILILVLPSCTLQPQVPLDGSTMKESLEERGEILETASDSLGQRKYEGRPDSPEEYLLALFEKFGVKLNKRQLEEVMIISDRYDLLQAPDKETRRKLKANFIDEVIEKVLTPEQKAQAKAVKAEREKSGPQ